MRLSLLGSTGSIGTQALEVISQWDNPCSGARSACTPALSDNAPPQKKIVALAAGGRNIKLLEQQARRFSPELVCAADEAAGRSLKTSLADTPVKVLYGAESVIDAAAYGGADTVLNALSGVAGLRPTLAALGADKQLLLANKESLVCGGEIVMRAAKRRIIPVDSEHSALFQLLNPPSGGVSGLPPGEGAPAGGGGNGELFRVLLTASGGPFRELTLDQLRSVTPEMALAHPTWRMGAKITIDSATLLNKGYEVIEAVHLFGLPQEKIGVVVHPESIIHALLEYNDGAVFAHMAVPDMRLPIQYALTYSSGLPRQNSPVSRLNLAQMGKLTFEEPDGEKFPLLPLAQRVARMGGNAGAILCGAGEGAVEAFIERKIDFLGIYEHVLSAFERIKYTKSPTIEEIMDTVDRAKALPTVLNRSDVCNIMSKR